MPQVDSLTLILLSEGFVGLLICVIIYLVWVLRRKSRDQLAVRDFIEQLNDSEEERLFELRQRLKRLTSVSDESLSHVLSELSQQEKALYKQIIEIFLYHSLSSVIAIEHRVQAITEPFYKLLAESNGAGGSTATLQNTLKTSQEPSSGSGDQAARLKQLRFESNQLAEQLNAALETLDEVSSEYSKMFGESKSADELAASQRKMLNTYRQAEIKSREIIGSRNDDGNLGA